MSTAPGFAGWAARCAGRGETGDGCGASGSRGLPKVAVRGAEGALGGLGSDVRVGSANGESAGRIDRPSGVGAREDGEPGSAIGVTGGGAE